MDDLMFTGLENQDAERVNPYEKLAGGVRRSREGRWEYAKWYSFLFNQADASHREIYNATLEQTGVEIPEKSQSSKLKIAYTDFVKKYGYSLEDVKDVSPHAIYEVCRYKVANHTNHAAWLQRAKTLTTKQLKQAMTGRVVETDKWTNLRIDPNVGEMRAKARQWWSEAVGLEHEMSDTVYDEVLAQLVLESGRDALRAIWRREHDGG